MEDNYVKLSRCDSKSDTTISDPKSGVNLTPLAELASRLQWVCWRYEKNAKGKLTKIPYNALTGEKASTTDPDTWTSYEHAQASCENNHYDGVGFVFNNDYTGIDLDHCIIAATGKPNEWAQGIIDRMNSYTEYSPSRTGVHIICRGTIPSGVKRPNIEMYCRGRFFTITGNLLKGDESNV